MNKHWFKYYFFILAVMFSMMSCSSDKKSVQKEIITVSILPQKYIIDKISLGELKVNVLIPPGASPASYEATPRQLAEFDHSLIYFRMGHIIFEKTWIKKIMERSPDLKVVDLSKDLHLIRNEEEHENDEHGDHHGHDHGIYDPHIWMSPKNMIKISEKVYAELISLFPEKSDEFRNNYNLLKHEIMEIDSLFKMNQNKLEAIHFLIYHPALTYLALDYGMTQHVLEAEGKEPGPAHMMKLIKTARENNISYIFIQKQFSRDNAEALAKEINAEIIEIEPLSENWSLEMKKILDILTKD